MENNIIGYIYRCVYRTLTGMGRKAVRLWGISLLYLLLSFLAVCLGVVPIVSIPLVLALTLGFTNIVYKAYLGEEFASQELFRYFKTGFRRSCGGMAWMLLWIFVWALIPIAGIFFAVYKAYSYRFVPYILITKPELTAAEALRLSAEETRGYKGLMFGADIIIILGALFVILILSLLGMIPIIGWLFKIILFIVYITCAAVLPLIFKLVSASFYHEAYRESEFAKETEPANEVRYCPACGSAAERDMIFCGTCGTKLGIY